MKVVKSPAVLKLSVFTELKVLHDEICVIILSCTRHLLHSIFNRWRRIMVRDKFLVFSPTHIYIFLFLSCIDGTDTLLWDVREEKWEK